MKILAFQSFCKLFKNDAICLCVLEPYEIFYTCLLVSIGIFGRMLQGVISGKDIVEPKVCALSILKVQYLPKANFNVIH